MRVLKWNRINLRMLSLSLVDADVCLLNALLEVIARIILFQLLNLAAFF